MSLGMFAIVAQTLLFRSFMTAMDGNELAIGCFFSSWLLWVGAGALLGRVVGRRHPGVIERFPLLPLLYVPAFLLQHGVFLHLRPLLGIPGYRLLSLPQMLTAAFLANAPVSLTTGCLFTLACRRFFAEHRLPVAHVYLLEAVGAGSGGLLATGLLLVGVGNEMVFIAASALLLVPAVLHLRGRRRLAVETKRQLPHGGADLILPALAVLAILVGALQWGVDYAKRQRWEQLLPADHYRFSFTTPQAEYLVGEADGQYTVVSGGSTVETLPNVEPAAAVVAMHLAQNPNAGRVLIVGNGSCEIVRQFLRLQQIREVVWIGDDPAYPQALRRKLPDHLQPQSNASRARLSVRHDDLRTCLQDPGTYDLVIINVADPTTLAANRHFTHELFQEVSPRLRDGGIVSLRVPGAENYLGPELASIGASGFYTLAGVFPYLAIKPGEDTWIFASNQDRPSSSAAVLTRRYAARPEFAAVYPAAGLEALFPPDRVTYQVERYTAAANRTPRLLNRDARPQALFHALLLRTRQAGTQSGTTAVLRRFAENGTPLLPAAVLIYLLLRLLYRLSPYPARGRPAQALPTAYDSVFLTAVGGAVAMGLHVLLMFQFQARHGAVFAYVGLLSACFMVGLVVGAGLLTRLSAAGRLRVPVAMVMLLGCHALLATCVQWFAATSVFGFQALFLLSGIVAGGYVPLAARQLGLLGIDTAATGSLVELGDHVGAAIGGVLAGLVLLPVFGLPAAVLVLLAMLALNLLSLLPTEALSAWLRARLPAGQRSGGSERDTADRLVRGAGYAMVGLLAFLCFAARQLRPPPPAKGAPPLLQAARRLLPKAESTPTEMPGPDGDPIPYVVWKMPDGTSGYCYNSAAMVDDIHGYAGPIPLVVVVDRDGVLRQLEIQDNLETPEYFDLTRDWQRQLIGKQIFTPEELKNVDAVSGATITAECIRDTLKESGAVFAAALAGNTAGRKTSTGIVDRHGLLLLTGLIVVLILRRLRARRLRFAVLALSAVVCGLALNLQFSTFQILSLLAGRLPPPALGLPFVLVIGVPLLVLLAGNVYCGYLCPFGALQELVGQLRPTRFDTVPAKSVSRWTRLLKYVLLFIIVLLFLTSADIAITGGDPLTAAFSPAASRAMLGFVVLLLLPAFFYPRFWCRHLCPTGAFLAILNRVQLLRFLAPRVNHQLCPFGVRDTAEIDCICCDRCRHATKAEAKACKATASRPRRTRDFIFVLVTICAAIIFLHLLLQFRTPAATTVPAAAGSEEGRTATGDDNGKTGKPRRRRRYRGRRTDADRIRQRIDAGELSDREARFYEEVEE